jgi:O-antigen/teichoic acid export membrane protein
LAQVKTLFKQTAIYGLSTILGRLVNFLLVPLHTMVLPKAEYGINTDLYTLIAFLMVLLTHGMETAYFHFREREPNAEARVFSTAFWSVVGVSLTSLVLMGVFFEPLAAALRYQGQSELLMLMMAILLTDSLSALPFARLRAQQKALRFAALRLGQVLLTVLFNAYFLLWCPYALEQGYGAYTLGFSTDVPLVTYTFWANLLANGLMLVALRPQLKGLTAPAGVWWPAMLTYGLPLMVAGFAGMINELLDRQLIKYLLPPDVAMDQLGVYSAVYKLSIFLVLFNQAFRYAAEPFFFRSETRNNPLVYARVMRYYLWVMALAVVAVVCSLDVLQYVIGPAYREGLWLVPILLMANYFSGINVNLNIWYKITGQTRFGLYITASGAVVTVAVNLWLLPIMGIAGAAWATLASYATMTVVSYLLGQRRFPVPYDLRQMTLLTVMVALIAFAAYFVLGGMWWAQVLLMLGFVMFFLWREQAALKHLLKR